MKKLISLFTAAVLVAGLCACKSTAARWQEQYDLGIRYMEDGNYEEAILSFNAAIEIDPMQADAYLNLANAYIGMNDFDAAKEILEKGFELTGAKVLKDKLDEMESGNIFDYWGNPRKCSGFDGTGTLQWYQIFEYNGKQTASVTTYNAAGKQTGYWDGFRYDEQGRAIRTMYSSDNDGLIIGYCEPLYDEKGNNTRSNIYDLDGMLIEYLTFAYDEDGRQISYHNYGADGELRGYSKMIYKNDQIACLYVYNADGTILGHREYRYDENGKEIGSVYYDANGKVISEQWMGD